MVSDIIHCISSRSSKSDDFFQRLAEEAEQEAGDEVGGLGERERECLPGRRVPCSITGTQQVHCVSVSESIWLNS